MLKIYRYYGQNGEDYILWNFFKYKKKGFYIDVGAFDGLHYSNTKSFEEQGWNGICVEAHPLYYEKLTKTRENSINLHSAAIGDPNLEKIEFSIEQMGLRAIPTSIIMQDMEDSIRLAQELVDFFFEAKRV